MTHKTFFWFFLPAALAMILFKAFPIGSVIVQSVYAPHEQVIVEVENCDVFGCSASTTINQEAMRALREAEPLGRYVGSAIYADRNHLAVSEVATAWDSTPDIGAFMAKLMNLPFYKALAFTLTYTVVVTPMALLLGFVVALSVNTLPRIYRGPTIFASLLPFIVTPLVGALILAWMVDSRGILGAGIQSLVGDPDLSVRASMPLTWAMLMVYGIWSSTPFAFVIYYAGLQTVPHDTLESAMVDGANRWERIRYVVLPHLLPLTVFIVLIKIMDNFRVFEPIISFNADAYAQSLSFFIYDDLGGKQGDARLLSSAAATSLLTILGVLILLSPVLVRTWKSFGRSPA